MSQGMQAACSSQERPGHRFSQRRQKEPTLLTLQPSETDFGLLASRILRKLICETKNFTGFFYIIPIGLIGL